MRFDPTELVKFGGLALVARRVVEGFLTGIHRSPFKGFSIEFAEHRQYYPGDEIRHIDWRVLGKTDRYYIKEYEEETNLRAMLVVDSSGSMGYRGKAPHSKAVYAQQVAASLAYLLLSQLDAVGVLTHDSKLRDYLPPRTTSKQLLRILQTLEKTRPGSETSLGEVWDELATRYLVRRGLVILISDGFDQLERIRLALRHLRHRRHEVIFLQILAREELDFPFRKTTEFRDLEHSGNQKLIDARRMREEYLKNFEAHQQGLRKACSELQIDLETLVTDVPVERALGHYLSQRN